MPGDAEAVLEADRCSLIEPEQIAGIATETPLPKIAVEPVRELEARPVEWEPQRGRQVENAKIRLGEHRRGIVLRGRRSWLAGGFDSRSARGRRHTLCGGRRGPHGEQRGG